MHATGKGLVWHPGPSCVVASFVIGERLGRLQVVVARGLRLVAVDLRAVLLAFRLHFDCALAEFSVQSCKVGPYTWVPGLLFFWPVVLGITSLCKEHSICREQVMVGQFFLWSLMGQNCCRFYELNLGRKGGRVNIFVSGEKNVDSILLGLVNNR